MKVKRPKPLDFGAVPKTSEDAAARLGPAFVFDDAAAPAPPPTADPEIELAVPAMAQAEPEAALPASGPAPRPPKRAAPPTQAPVDHLQPSVKEPAAGRFVYLAALVVSVMWGLGPIAYALGYLGRVSPLDQPVFALIVLGLLAIGPIGLVWVAAFVLKQGLRLAAEARRNKALARDMLEPAVLAAAKTGSIVETVRREIDSATAAAAQARNELAALREVLALETERLVEAAGASARTAEAVTQGLGKEREALGALSTTLDAQVVGVADAITRQARMVAEASDLAETQLREAEAALAARAADLAAAAGETGDVARIASEDLTRQSARLEAAGATVGEQARLVEEGLAEQRGALVAIVHGLRTEQEDFAAQIESQQAQLAELVAKAYGGASELGEAASRNAENLQRLIGAAADQFRELAEAAKEERDLFGASAMHSLNAIADAASQQRLSMESEARRVIDDLASAAEQAREAAAAQAEVARLKIDQLGEAAFGVGQKADALFESRLNEARTLIERSADLVDEAGARSAKRLEESVGSTRQTLAELENLLAELEARTARLPADAQSRSQEVQAAVERGVDHLLASARKAAEETQAIDAAFQERVRRNYEMLSEAVRLMGVVGGAASGAASASRPARSPLSSVSAQFSLRPDPAPTAAPRAAPPAPPPAPDAAATSGLRPRLKLTPTASDAEFADVFDAAGGRAPAEPQAAETDGWTWKELLSSMDDDVEGGEQTAVKLIAEIEALGIDAAALLPRARIEEVAAELQDGDIAAAREMVKRLAPAAVRRLSRRLLADRGLRTQAERFVRRYEGLLADGARRDPQGELALSLLTTDQGRAFLLLEAATGDVG